MALLRRSFHGVVMRSFGVLIGERLSSDCASTEFFALPLRFLSVHTKLSLRLHCDELCFIYQRLLTSASVVCFYIKNRIESVIVALTAPLVAVIKALSH
jgi:hypothetical protein